MKAKRLIALLLSLIMILSCFAACGGEDKEKEEKETEAESDGGEDKENQADLGDLVDEIINQKEMQATVDIRFSVMENGKETVFLERQGYTVKAKQDELTVLTAAKKLLEEYDVEYSVTADGTNLESVKSYRCFTEESGAKRSAYFWDFKVNGADPKVSSAKDELIYQDDVITFVFTSVSINAPAASDEPFESEFVVPRMISKKDFEDEILANITVESDKNRFSSFYALYDASDITVPLAARYEMLLRRPVSEKLPVYVCETDISNKELDTLNDILNEYCPDYTMEDRDADHKECGFAG